MIEAVDVEPRDGYRIWLRYSDGASGEVDLSDMAGRGGFKRAARMPATEETRDA